MAPAHQPLEPLNLKWYLVTHSKESRNKLAGIRYGTVSAACSAALGARLLERGGNMLYYALVFLVVGLIAAVLGVSGVASVATNIAYVLFVIALVLFVVHLLSGRRTLAP